MTSSMQLFILLVTSLPDMGSSDKLGTVKLMSHNHSSSSCLGGGGGSLLDCALCLPKNASWKPAIGSYELVGAGTDEEAGGFYGVGWLVEQQIAWPTGPA